MGDPSGQLQDGLLDRARVFRVNVDGTALQCLETNEGAAEGEAAIDREAAILQELGHDLGQDLALDVLLAADHNRPGVDRRREQHSKDDAKAALSYLQDLSAAVKDAAAQGKCYDAAMKEIKLPKYESWPNYANNLPMNIERYCDYYNRGI